MLSERIPNARSSESNKKQTASGAVELLVPHPPTCGCSNCLVATAADMAWQVQHRRAAPARAALGEAHPAAEHAPARACSGEAGSEQDNTTESTAAAAAAKANRLPLPQRYPQLLQVQLPPLLHYYRNYQGYCKDDYTTAATTTATTAMKVKMKH